MLEAVPTETEPRNVTKVFTIEPASTNLTFHSRPGASNVLFLNFTGEEVSGTAWNAAVGRDLIPAMAFSTDADYSTFSDAEQLTIKRIWQRVAEDFAPFDIDVTTERPSAFGPRIALALITRNTDANGLPNPAATAGGVAYVDVFGSGDYTNHQPAWIYFDNLCRVESYIAEAVSHEIGHNLGLSHDAQTDGSYYYSGHGCRNTSWGPIMGSSYGRNVSQWSRGEYYLANNTEDDLAIIADKIAYRSDDHGDTAGTATPLVVADGTNVASTTPENDPSNSVPANRGVLERDTDMDVFSFPTGNGLINLTVNPWVTPSGTRGGNLDVLLELRDATGALLLTSDPPDGTGANIQANLPEGRYFLFVRNTGVGDPFSPTPNGYTAYASSGQYFVSGYLTATTDSNPTNTDFALTVTANNPAWGTATPSVAAYPSGSPIEAVATPAAYYRFDHWSGDVTTTNNPLTLVLNGDTVLQANFTEILTPSHPTPVWWLAAHGFTQDLETVVTDLGANGMPIWQSYIAGLNPNDPEGQLRLSLTPASDTESVVLNWTTVTGRVYTVHASTNLTVGFSPLPGCTDLPATVASVTNALTLSVTKWFYRLEVRKP